MFVEIIGPPGIGKSTHYNLFKKCSSIDHQNWKDIDRVFKWEDIQNEHVKDYHIDILLKSIESLNNRQLQKVTHIQLIQYFCAIILRDIKCFHINGCIIKDGSIFHEFMDEIIDITNNSENLIKDLFKDRIFIIITGDPYLIYERIRQTPINVLIPFSKDKDRVIKDSEDYILKAKKLVAIIDSFKIPFLILQLDNGIDENVKLMDVFIKTNLK